MFLVLGLQAIETKLYGLSSSWFGRTVCQRICEAESRDRKSWQPVKWSGMYKKSFVQMPDHPPRRYCSSRNMAGIGLVVVTINSLLWRIVVWLSQGLRTCAHVLGCRADRFACRRNLAWSVAWIDVFISLIDVLSSSRGMDGHEEWQKRVQMQFLRNF